MLLDQADVIVVGGGIAGVSTAHSLKTRGFDVILIEQRFVAFGASGRNSGCIWLQTARSGPELDLARQSKAMYRSFTEQLGDTFDYRDSGGLFFFDTDEQQQQLTAYVDDRNAHGVHCELVSARQARKMSTSVPDTAIGAVYSADDAQVNTAKFSRVLADACRRSGVRVYENTAALRLIRHAGAVIGVRTVRGDVMAEGVVWSTGAWAVNLESEGISLPVTPVRVGMLVTQPVTERSTVITHGPHGAENCTALMDLPGFRAEDFSPEVTTGVSDLTYEDVVAQNAEGSIMIGHTYEAAQSLNPHVTLDATQMMVQTIRHRRPDFGRLGVTGLWAGLVGVTPDALPIITKTDGLFVNTGHSLCTASGPPSGELMAQLVAGEEPSIDLSAFALDRPSLAGPATS